MKKYISILLLLLTITACTDDFDEWGYVNFFIEPDTTEYYNLNMGARGWEYFEGGNRGVIVVRNSHEVFMAYERSCTRKNCKGRLEVDTTNNVLISCPDCNARWLCVDGSPMEDIKKSKSNAPRILYSYCSYYDGYRLYVNNCAGN